MVSNTIYINVRFRPHLFYLSVDAPVYSLLNPVHCHITLKYPSDCTGTEGRGTRIFKAYNYIRHRAAEHQWSVCNAWLYFLSY